MQRLIWYLKDRISEAELTSDNITEVKVDLDVAKELVAVLLDSYRLPVTKVEPLRREGATLK